MNNQKNMPVISVVVPVYRTEKYLRKCLDSILGQTYKNIELIVVNDASTDNSEEIIKEYLLKYDNMKYVRHKENRGLFQARISGAEEATGDYIAFVDSDDYISVDFYRLMINAAQSNNADMVLSDFFLEYAETGKREYYNHDPLRLQNIDYKGENILKAYMEQRGLFYSWQVIWNKLISINLWKSCIEDYKKFSKSHGHLIMTEDIAFSSNLWIHATHVINVHNAVYFYVQNQNQSIKNDKTFKKYLKNQTDVLSVFEFFKNILIKSGKYEEYKVDYIEWKRLYGRIYYGIFNDLPEKPSIEKFDYSAFEMKEISWPDYNDNFFYSLKTPVSDAFNWFENIKRGIMSKECEIVSFDIFDTLILRSYFQPTDLFSVLNDKFNKLFDISSYMKFSDIRILSEANVRRIKYIDNPQFNEVTLDEIYTYISDRYHFDIDKLKSLMKIEIDEEIKCSSCRKAGSELYDLALFCNKTIIFTSDMYLPESAVKSILDKNGYFNGQLYVSSTLKITKADGNLYDYILKRYDVEAKNVLHIGDNWFSDTDTPLKKGIVAHYLPKTLDVYKNSLSSIYAGEIFEKCFSGYNHFHDMSNSFNNYIALRKMLSVVGNKFFDNPYISFNQNSDFNADPRYVGYFSVGFYVFSIAHWLLKEAKRDGVKKIHFVARDGYLVKQAYDIISNLDKNAPSSNYLYVSRTTTSLLDINSPTDLYSLYYKLSAWHATPIKVLNSIKEILPLDADTVLQNIAGDVPFNSREEFDGFIAYLIENFSDKMDFSTHLKNAKEYFKSIIGENEAIFDIGYSGRVELAITRLLGYPVNSYYIHKNSDNVNDKMLNAGFVSKSFYCFKPMVTGVIREHIMMKLAGTTIGYDYDNKTALLDKFECDYSAVLMTNLVQNNAIEFVNDIASVFGKEILNWCFEYEDAVLPFEYYLHDSKIIDRSIFSTLIFEDVVGEGKEFRAIDFWNNQIKEYQNNICSKISNSSQIIDERVIGVNDVPVIQPSEITPICDDKIGDNVKCAIFLDTIVKTDSVEDKFAKCAGNTSNIIDWNTINETIKPKVIPNWFMTNPGGFESDDFDIFLTTNLIWVEENTDLTYLDKVLERIGDKVLFPMGIGLSSKEDKKDFKLSDDSIKTLHKIAERCKSIGVKGNYTAEILNGFGIKNIDVIGLPAMYNNISNMKSLKTDSKINKIKTISSFRPFYGKVSANEKKLLSYMMINGCSLMDTTALELQKSNFADDKLYDRVKAWEKKKNTYFDIEKWKESFKDTDFCFGLNFQNNMLAMQCGIPALFINYESTGRELCKFFDLPAMDISEFDDKKGILNYYKMADMSKFIKNIDDKYKEYCAFLKKNGINIVDIRNRIIEK